MFKSLRTMCVCLLSLAVVLPAFADEEKQPPKKTEKKVEKKVEKKADKQVEKNEAAKKAEQQPAEKAAAKKQTEDKKAAKKPAKDKLAAGLAQAAKYFQPPQGVKLNEDQIAQLRSLKQKYASQLKDALATAKLKKEQATARKEAMVKGKADGLKGKQLQQAADAAAKLTDKQQQAKQTLASIRKEVRTSIRGMLTEEQKAKLPGKKQAKKAAAE
jgi:hypothetical protein